MNLRPSGYEPDELPGCSIPRQGRKVFHRIREMGDFSRFGGDLLSRGLSPSTIGAAVLNFRVRDGTGCFTCAMTTKPRKIPTSAFAEQKRRVAGSVFACKCALPLGRYVNQQCRLARHSHPLSIWCMFLICLSITGSNQAYRAISTGQLNALLRLHLRPIDVVVFHGPQGDLVLRGASRLDAFSGYPVRS